MTLNNLGFPVCLFLRIWCFALLATCVVYCKLESNDVLMHFHYSNHLLMSVSFASLQNHERIKHVAMPHPMVVRLPLHFDICQLAQAESQWTLGSKSG